MPVTRRSMSSARASSRRLSRPTFPSGELDADEMIEFSFMDQARYGGTKTPVWTERRASASMARYSTAFSRNGGVNSDGGNVTPGSQPSYLLVDEAREEEEQERKFRLARTLFCGYENNIRFDVYLSQLEAFRKIRSQEFAERLGRLPQHEAERLRRQFEQAEEAERRREAAAWGLNRSRSAPSRRRDGDDDTPHTTTPPQQQLYKQQQQQQEQIKKPQQHNKAMGHDDEEDGIPTETPDRLSPGLSNSALRRFLRQSPSVNTLEDKESPAAAVPEPRTGAPAAVVSRRVRGAQPFVAPARAPDSYHASPATSPSKTGGRTGSQEVYAPQPVRPNGNGTPGSALARWQASRSSTPRGTSRDPQQPQQHSAREVLAPERAAVQATLQGVATAAATAHSRGKGLSEDTDVWAAIRELQRAVARLNDRLSVLEMEKGGDAMYLIRVLQEQVRHMEARTSYLEM